MSDAVETVVSVSVVAVVVAEYWRTVKYSTARYLPLQPLICATLAVVYCLSVAEVEDATFVLVSQLFQILVHPPRLLEPHCHAVTKRRATGELLVEPTAMVRSICQVPA